MIKDIHNTKALTEKKVMYSNIGSRNKAFELWIYLLRMYRYLVFKIIDFCGVITQIQPKLFWYYRTHSSKSLKLFYMELQYSYTIQQYLIINLILVVLCAYE